MVVVVVPSSALTSGKVRLAPDSLAEAPMIPSALAFGPRVTVLVQPAPRSAIVAIAISVFIYVFLLKPRLEVRIRELCQDLAESQV